MTATAEAQAAVLAIEWTSRQSPAHLLLLRNHAYSQPPPYASFLSPPGLPDASQEEFLLNTIAEAAALLLHPSEIVIIDGLPFWDEDHETPAADFAAGREDTQALCAALIRAGAKQIEP